jgi:hypothetical protein
MEENEPGGSPEAYRRHLDRESPRRQAAREQEAGWESGDRAWRDPDPLEQRLDRWVSAGKQFVGGVAGARPGSRSGGSGRGGGGGSGRGAGRTGLDGLGRWVEGKLDWLLEDGDEWREPWQEPQAQAGPLPSGPPAASPRRRLEAVSRRGEFLGGSTPAVPGQNGTAGEAGGRAAGPPALEEWPDDTAFSLPRWKRDLRPPPASEPAPGPPVSGGRPLPRSSRRR